MRRSLRRVFSALRYDIMFQWRHGFYAVYLVIVLLYAVSLRFVPGRFSAPVTVLLLFSDTSVLGVFFVGGLVLLERSQNTFESLFVTPLRIWEYLAVKVLSLTLIALLMSFAVVLGGYGWRFSPLPLFLGVGLTSAFFTLTGLALASRVRTMNGYFGVTAIVLIAAPLPLLDFFGILSSPLFLPFPTQASLVLFRAAFGTPSAGELAYGVLTLLLWIAGAGLWASRWFRTYVLVQAGDEPWPVM